MVCFGAAVLQFRLKLNSDSPFYYFFLLPVLAGRGVAGPLSAVWRKDRIIAFFPLDILLQPQEAGGHTTRPHVQGRGV